MDESEDRYRILAENATDVVSEVTAEGVWTWISPSVESLLGWKPADLVGRSAFDFVHPNDLGSGMEVRERVTSGERVSMEVRIRCADGSYRWVSAIGKAIYDADGEIVARTAGWRDIHAEVMARKDLAASNEKYRMLAENAADVVWQTNTEGVIQWVSDSIRSVLGWRPDEVIGHQSLEFINMLDQGEVLAQRPRILQGQPVTRWQGRYRCADGDFRWMSVQVRPLSGPGAEVIGMIVGLRDVHDEVLAREALARSERKFRLALDGAPQGMAIVSLNRDYLTVNDALCRMLGRSRSWLLEHNLVDVLSPEDNEIDLAARDLLLAGVAEHDTREVRFTLPDGQTVWAMHSIGLLRDESSMPLFYVSQYQDVTETRRIHSQLAYQAGHDLLTGLLNRNEFADKTEAFLERKPRHGALVGMLFCDIDWFKQTNDTRGHRVGDLVIAEVANRIRSSVRKADLVARIGGDEFVILLDGIAESDNAAQLAEKIRSAASEPLQLVGESAPVSVTVSIGAWVGPPGETIDHMMSAADRALYKAKHRGRNRTELTVAPEVTHQYRDFPRQNGSGNRGTDG